MTPDSACQHHLAVHFALDVCLCTKTCKAHALHTNATDGLSDLFALIRGHISEIGLSRRSPDRLPMRWCIPEIEQMRLHIF